MGVMQVAAAAVFDRCGRVLITQRAAGAHQGGLWEFPGGKLEPGESAREGLQRELREEVGIHITHARPLIRVRHEYPERAVLLDVWRVEGFTGKAHGREGQPLRWVALADLAAFDFPAANRPILRAVSLPDRYLITPEPAETADFLPRLAEALARGVRLVQLRSKQLGEREYVRLARQAVALCHAHRARLLLSGDPALARDSGADGVHLDSPRLWASTVRPDLDLVGASCHGARELAQAAAIDADFALLSPVAATTSHPQALPLGWARFRALSDAAPLPVYALGGMALRDLETAWAHGAQGIAAIRGLWEG